MTMTLEDKSLAADLAPQAPISGFSRVTLLAQKVYKKSVNPETDGRFASKEDMLSSVIS